LASETSYCLKSKKHNTIKNNIQTLLVLLHLKFGMHLFCELWQKIGFSPFPNHFWCLNATQNLPPLPCHVYHQYKKVSIGAEQCHFQNLKAYHPFLVCFARITKKNDICCINTNAAFIKGIWTFRWIGKTFFIYSLSSLAIWLALF
jgi:hypothetical protein